MTVHPHGGGLERDGDSVRRRRDHRLWADHKAPNAQGRRPALPLPKRVQQEGKKFARHCNSALFATITTDAAVARQCNARLVHALGGMVPMSTC